MKRPNPIQNLGLAEIAGHARSGRSGSSFFRFNPRRAVTELRRKKPTYVHSKEWMVMCLLFWSFLDGRPGKRSDSQSDPQKANPNAKPPNKIWTPYARRAGNLLLLAERHRMFLRRGSNNTVAEIDALFEATEGYANAIVGDSADDLLRWCREAKPRIDLILEIVQYLARRSALPADRRSVGDAIYYVATQFMSPVKSKRYSRVKTLELDVWAEFKESSPYLFAFHTDAKFKSLIFSDLEECIAWVSAFCADRLRVQSFLGRAAAISDVLKECKVRKCRANDFKKVARVELRMKPFSRTQMETITNQDRRSAETADDAKDFRPKLVQRRS